MSGCIWRDIKGERFMRCEEKPEYIEGYKQLKVVEIKLHI